MDASLELELPAHGQTHPQAQHRQGVAVLQGLGSFSLRDLGFPVVFFSSDQGPRWAAPFTWHNARLAQRP